MARTDKPGAAGGPQQPRQPAAAAIRPQGMAQFPTVGGYVMGAAQVPGGPTPQQLAQQAAGGRPAAFIAVPGQPGQLQAMQLVNPALGQQASMQALYAQQLQATQAYMQAQQQQQQAQQQQGAQRPVGQAPAAAGAQSANSAIQAPGAQQAGARPALQPPTNFTIHLKMPTGDVRPYPIPPEFLRAHPSEWQAWVTNPSLHHEMWQRYSLWHMNRNAAAAANAAAVRPGAAPPAKRPKAEASSAASGVRPQQLPAHMAAGGMRTPSPGLPGAAAAAPQLPATAGAAGAAATAALQQRLAAMAGGPGGAAGLLGFPPITKPGSEEDKEFLPKPRLQQLVREACGPGARLTGDAEQALKNLAQEFVANAVAFGVSMAKRRKGEQLEPADLQLYLERTWNLQVPGFSEAEVRPYRRPAASDIHKARMAAVRRSAADAAAAKAAAQPEAGPGAAGAGPSGAALAADGGAARDAEAAEGRAPPAAAGAGAGTPASASKGGRDAAQRQNGAAADAGGAGTPAARGGGGAAAGKGGGGTPAVKGGGSQAAPAPAAKLPAEAAKPAGGGGGEDDIDLDMPDL